jgi:uncharacterized protein YbjQ (UPF0145 family)
VNENPEAARAVCTCNNCPGKLEFDPEQAGEMVQCPHCGMETMLFVPGAPIPNRKHDEQPTYTPPRRQGPVVTTTGNDVSGQTIESYLGIVRGIVVRAPDAVQNLFGGLKQIIGGNIESFARVCEEARGQAFERMVEHARQIDADAIIGVRYDATEFAPGVTEVLAYGTAVKLAKR